MLYSLWWFLWAARKKKRVTTAKDRRSSSITIAGLRDFSPFAMPVFYRG
jgi:hypothetical protein